MALEEQIKTFLSYSRINKNFAVKLAKGLKSEGLDVWLDTLDIPLGARWDREVEKALKESEIFMIILTPESVNSENVLDEIGYAIDTGKRILPILLENCEVPLRLRRLQYVDFTNKSFDEGVVAAKELLQGLIAQYSTLRGTGASGTQIDDGQDVKEEADRKSKPWIEPDTRTSTTLPKKPASIGLIAGIGIAILLVLGSIGYSIFSNKGSKATEAPIVYTEAPIVEAPTITETPTVAVILTATEVSVDANNRILFDTTHREWGVYWGEDDLSFVRSLGYRVDESVMPSGNTLDKFDFNLSKDEKLDFEFSTTNDYPYIAIYTDGTTTSSIPVTLQIGNISFSDYFWYPDPPFIHPALFVNTAGNHSGRIGPIDSDNGVSGNLIVAGLNQAPITNELLQSYHILWFHNAFNPFLPEEQKAILDYLDMGGTVLLIDGTGSNFSFLSLGTPNITASLTNSTVVNLYEYGAGRIAQVIPSGNPYLYYDNGNDAQVLSDDEVKRVFSWLETGTW